MILFRRLPFDPLSGLPMAIPKLVLSVVLLINFKQLSRQDWLPTVWRTLIIVLFV